MSLTGRTPAMHRMLAEVYDRHAREHAPDNRCGCDLCEWIESTPGVLQAIASVAEPELPWNERVALHRVFAAARYYLSAPESERPTWITILGQRVQEALPYTLPDVDPRG